MNYPTVDRGWKMSRRKFLLASGVVGGGAIAAGATAVTFDKLMNAAKSNPLPSDAHVLVLITLYGGNDGLNTVVPASDPVYQDLRPELAYKEDEVLSLGEGLGLNESMKGFKSLWDKKKLAIVRGVSYPKPDHSHFRSMAIWQTASPDTSVRTGWLGRWLDAGEPDPLRAVSIGATLPPLLAGAELAGSALPLGGLHVPKGIGADLAGLAKPQSGEHPTQARVASSLHDMLLVDTKLSGEEKETDDEGDDRPGDGASAGGQGQLGAQLAVIARAIREGVPTRVYCASLGGFDTHSNEKGTQSRLLGELDKAVSGFLTEVQKTPAGKKVVVAVYSEFGRRVRANASQGTDHGTAGPVFVVGEPVRGGFFGEQPDLKRLVDDDLPATTDFRDVYATLLGKALDTDPGIVLPGREGSMAFL